MTRKNGRRRHLSSKEARKLLLNVDNPQQTEREHRAAALKRLATLSIDHAISPATHEAQVHACEAILRNTTF